MKLYHNPEVRNNIFNLIFINAAAIIAAFFAGIKSGIIMIITCVCLDIFFFVVTRRRYIKISELSEEINKILNDCSRFDLSGFREGELGILQSEIYKMTVRLREQADTLTKDKKYLADSIADISHQIRTPLTAINLIIEFLSEPDLTDDRKFELIKELEGLLSRIEWLINTLLKISKLDAGTLRLDNTKVNVKRMINNAYNPISISMELRNQELLIDCDESIFFIGDMGTMQEAIENILKNCMEHTPDGGTIEIHVTDSLVYTGITISDNGVGISPDDLPYVFKRFYKGKDSADSSVGIGLAYARMIINAQNGTIKAENNKECGASFIIKLYKTVV